MLQLVYLSVYAVIYLLIEFPGEYVNASGYDQISPTYYGYYCYKRLHIIIPSLLIYIFYEQTVNNFFQRIP